MNTMRQTIFAGLAALVLAVGSAATPAAAGEPLRVAQSGGPTLSQAIDQVRRQYGGRIVSAETRVRGNREVHVIKVLTDDGKVKTVTVPGRTLNG